MNKDIVAVQSEKAKKIEKGKLFTKKASIILIIIISLILLFVFAFGFLVKMCLLNDNNICSSLTKLPCYSKISYLFLSNGIVKPENEDALFVLAGDKNSLPPGGLVIEKNDSGNQYQVMGLVKGVRRSDNEDYITIETTYSEIAEIRVEKNFPISWSSSDIKKGLLTGYNFDNRNCGNYCSVANGIIYLEEGDFINVYWQSDGSEGAGINLKILAEKLPTMIIAVKK